MGTNTARAKLYKPAENGELLDVKPAINDNMDKLDALAGTFVCTSTTRPAAPFVGMLIWQTDDKRIYVWSGTAWLLVTTGKAPTSQSFSGSGTWNKPAGLVALRCRVWGAGGAGGGAAPASGTQTSGGGGGGGGASSEAWFAADSLTDTVAVTVGAGGNGVAGAAGGNGGDSSFGTYLTAGGGRGGAFAAAGTGNAAPLGGAGGVAGSVSGASGGTSRAAGTIGHRTWLYSAANIGMTGPGGGNSFIQGSPGNGWNTDGVDGPIGGGGGSGSFNANGGTPARKGGDGGGGFVFVEHFFG